jgi:hypothetical protein
MIKALLDHKLKAWEDPALLPLILRPAISSLQAIDAYPTPKTPAPSRTIQRSDFQYSSFKSLSLECPGGIHVTFTDKTAYIGASYRWSSFLQIPELRLLHLNAIRAVAVCLNSSFAAYFPEHDLIYEFFYQESGHEDGFKILTANFGEPKPGPEDITTEDIKRRPSHWYLEFFNQE